MPSSRSAVVQCPFPGCPTRLSVTTNRYSNLRRHITDTKRHSKASLPTTCIQPGCNQNVAVFPDFDTFMFEHYLYEHYRLRINRRPRRCKNPPTTNDSRDSGGNSIKEAANDQIDIGDNNHCANGNDFNDGAHNTNSRPDDEHRSPLHTHGPKNSNAVDNEKGENGTGTLGLFDDPCNDSQCDIFEGSSPPKVRQPQSARPNGTLFAVGCNSTHGSPQHELSQLLSVFQQQIGQSIRDSLKNETASIRDSLKNEMASIRDSLNYEMASMRGSLTNEMAILRNTVNNSSSHPVDGTYYFNKKDVAEKNQELHHNLLKIGQQKFKEWCSGYGFNIKICKQSKDAYHEAIQDIMDHKVKFELNQIASDLKVDQKVVLDYVVGYISKKANNTKPCYCCVEVVKGHVITSTVCPPGMESKKIWKLSNREESVTGLNGPNLHNSVAPQLASQYRAPLSNMSNCTFPNAYQSVSRPSSTSSYGCHSDLPVRGSAYAAESSSQSYRDTGIRTQGACNQSQHKSQSVNTIDSRMSSGMLSENSRQSAIHDQPKQHNYFRGSQDYSSQMHIPRQSPSSQSSSVAGSSNRQASQVITGSQSSIYSNGLHSIDNRPNLGCPPQPSSGSMAFQAPNGLNSGDHRSYKIDPNPVIDTSQMDYTTLSSSLTIKLSDTFKPSRLKFVNLVCHGDLPIGRVREKLCSVGKPFAVSDPSHYCIKCGKRIHQNCGARVIYSDISQANNHVICFLCYESETENQRISEGVNSRRKAETHIQSSISKKSKHNHLEHFLSAPRPWTKDTLEKAYIEDTSLKRNNAFTVQVSEAHLLMAEFGSRLWIGPILHWNVFADKLNKYSAELRDMGKLMATIKWGLDNWKIVKHLNVFDRSNALTTGHTAYLYVMVRFNLCNLDMADFSVGLWKACVQILALYLGKCNGEILEKMDQWMKELAAMEGSQYLHIESVRWRPVDKVIEFLKKLFRMPEQKMQAMESMIWRLFSCAVEALCSMTKFSDRISTTEWQFGLMMESFAKVPTLAKLMTPTSTSQTINLTLFASTFLNYTPPQDQKLCAIHHSAFFVLSRILRLYNKAIPAELQAHHIQLQRIAMTADHSVKILLQDIGF